MENHRILLYFTLFFIIYLLWAQWQIDYGPKPETQVSVEPKSPVTVDVDIPTAAPDPSAPADVQAVAVEAEKKTGTSSQRIRVITDVFDIEIDTRGGDIRKATLRNYAVEAKAPDIKLDLLTDRNINFHIAQSGLVSANTQSNLSCRAKRLQVG